MRYIRTHEYFVRTIVHKAARSIRLTCDEYASVWHFTARICGWALPSAVDWSYKKKEYKDVESAKQAFLSDLAINTNY